MWVYQTPLNTGEFYHLPKKSAVHKQRANTRKNLVFSFDARK